MNKFSSRFLKRSVFIWGIIEGVSIHEVTVLEVVDRKIDETFINVELNTNIEVVLRSGAFQAIQIAQLNESVIRLPFPFCAANSSSAEKSISRANRLQNNFYDTISVPDFHCNSSKRGTLTGH